MKRNTFYKYIAVVAVIITNLLFSVQVNATSRTTTTELGGVGRSVNEAINANGPQVLGARRGTVSGEGVTIGSIEDKKVIATLSDLEMFAKLISEYTHTEVTASEIAILDTVEVKENPGTVVSEKNPIYLSFNFPGLNNTSEAYVFHYGTNGWEIVSGTVAEGKIIGEFTSFSPVAIIAKTSTLNGAVLGANRAISPRTGDYRFPIVAICLMVIAVAVKIAKKRLFS